MKLIEYVSELGAQTALARRLGVTPVLVHQWAHGVRRVPLERCVAIERATNGAVTCEELRPDLADYFAYLRGAADPRQSMANATPDEAIASASG